MQITPQERCKGSLTIVIFQYDKDGNEESAHSCEGHAIYNEADNTITIYKSDINSPIITLEEENFERIQKADEEMKEMLKSDYFITITIGTIPDDANMDDYNPLGFKAPGYE